MERSFRKLRCLFLVMLILSLFSAAAWAADYSAGLNSLHFDIALQEDGSALVTETREIVFSGDHLFSRYGVNNGFTGPRTFVDWQVTIDGTPASRLDAPDNDNRPENTFVVEDTDGGNTVSIYFRQQGDGTRVFRIRYRIENAVKLYADVGEFSWNLTGETGISDIGTLTATLTVPEGVPDEAFRIWAHGPLNGNFDKQPDGSAFLQVDSVPLGTIVDIRSTLPAACFTGGWEQQGEALDAILAEEKALSDSANARREEALRAQEEEARARAESEAYWAAVRAEEEAWMEAHPVQSALQNVCLSIYHASLFYSIAYQPFESIVAYGGPILVLTAIVGRLLRNKKKLRHTPAQSPQYYRDLPDHRPAPAVDRLIHFYDGKSSVTRQIPAALLELNLKGLVRFQTVDGEVTLWLNPRLGEVLFPSASPQEDGAQEQKQAHDPDDQEILWRFLSGAAEGREWMALTDLEQYIRDHQEAAWHFRNDFEHAVQREFQEQVGTEMVRRPLLGKSWRPLLLSAAVGILVMLICMFSFLSSGIFWSDSLCAGISAFAVTVILYLLYRLGRKFAQGRCEILDQQSEDDLALWQAFGRFLNDFTTFEDKELPEFSVWREFMVYAVAMGQGQKVARALSVKYPETLSAQTDAMSDEMVLWLQNMTYLDAMDSISREVSAARQPSAPSSGEDSSGIDNWSDSDGGGGGFSESSGGSDSGSSGDFID